MGGKEVKNHRFSGPYMLMGRILWGLRRTQRTPGCGWGGTTIKIRTNQRLKNNVRGTTLPTEGGTHQSACSTKNQAKKAERDEPKRNSSRKKGPGLGGGKIAARRCGRKQEKRATFRKCLTAIYS